MGEEKSNYNDGTPEDVESVHSVSELEEPKFSRSVSFSDEKNNAQLVEIIQPKEENFEDKISDDIQIQKVEVLEEEEEEEEYSCCDPRQSYYRFVALFFMCFLSFGSYFCYDTPGSLQDQITDDMDVSTVQFTSLYSLYSWPNVIMCFIGGFLIDRVFGVRLGAIIFSLITTLGQMVYSLGALINQFWLMQFGRFIFGIGGESLAVAQNTYTVAWFKGKELNTVFGLLLSMSRIGSTVNFLVMGQIYDGVEKGGDREGYVNLGISLFIAGITCILSLVCAFVLSILDKKRVKALKVGDASSGEKIELKDVLTFPLTFWLICVICVTYYVAIFPFIGLAKVFFMRKYDYQEQSANTVCSLVYVISAVASPACGFMVDKLGRNVFFVFLAILTSLFCHVLLAYTFFNPYVVMSILGIGYSLLASSLWPMVSLILPSHQIATAYGMMQSIQNLGLAVISLVGGLIVDSKGYFLLEMFYILWLCIALAGSIVLIGVDDSRGGYLMMTPKNRKIMDAKKQKSA